MALKTTVIIAALMSMMVFATAMKASMDGGTSDGLRNDLTSLAQSDTTQLDSRPLNVDKLADPLYQSAVIAVPICLGILIYTCLYYVMLFLFGFEVLADRSMKHPLKLLVPRDKIVFFVFFPLLSIYYLVLLAQHVFKDILLKFQWFSKSPEPGRKASLVTGAVLLLLGAIIVSSLLAVMGVEVREELDAVKNTDAGKDVEFSLASYLVPCCKKPGLVSVLLALVDNFKG